MSSTRLLTRRTTKHARAGVTVRVLVMCVAVLVGQLGAGAADAGPHPVTASVKGGCTFDGVYYSPYGQVYMKELGKSGVTLFRAKYRLYLTNVTAGWNFPRLEKTYRSPTFPNDNRNFYAYVPDGVFHRWTEVYGTNSYRLNAKLTYERPWRPDWNYSVDIARCG